MNEQWQQPAPLWVRAAPLALVIVGIIAAFVYMEGKRSERLVGESLRFSELLNGTVTAVAVMTPQMTNDHWERITSIPTLEHVDLSGVDDWGSGLESLTKLPHLRWLQLNRCSSLNDEQLAWLTENLSLEHLHVAECPHVTYKSVAPIIDCESLKLVDLWGTSINIHWLTKLREARRDLKISMNWDAFVLLPEDVQPGRKVYPSFGDSMERFAFKMDTQGHPQRSVLALPHNWKTGEWRADPGSQVLYLAISGHGAGAELRRLAQVLRNLGTLSVASTYIPADVGEWSPRLTLLSLTDLAEGSDLSGFADCTSLTSVSCWDRPTDSAMDLTFLEALPHLQTVTLGRPAVTVAEVELISRLPTVKALALYGVTDVTIAPLLDTQLLPELEDLTLYNAQVSGDVLEQLTSGRPEMTFSEELLP